jgi:predicted RNase H-like nuclease
MADYYGVDGCKGGWLCIHLDHTLKSKGVCYPTFAALMSEIGSSSLTLVDMPIGLPGLVKRQCDQIARRRLTRLRGSSVFPVPSREALMAQDYREACDLNQKALGVRISKQAWNLVPKIKEVDAWMLAQDPTQRPVRECHPELAFWAIQGGVPMQHAKKTPLGAKERLEALQRYMPQAPTFYDELTQAFPRRLVAPDDILDALVLALTAAKATALLSLPDEPQVDSAGLRMEITYGKWS